MLPIYFISSLSCRKRKVKDIYHRECHRRRRRRNGNSREEKGGLRTLWRRVKARKFSDLNEEEANREKGNK